ncbi:hypothetical protein CDD81_1824 [Ophiocordyceps australis]|uniref:Uncharacterized protein n=1 Tax=Ophiocordyceps australis TaxID=1399860 RepID=A0A2C5X7X0_9HYPO|nr:hypothetical protein CDD81_1824 [Ophiocordyceps australis]
MMFLVEHACWSKAKTLYIDSQSMTGEQAERKTVSLDCDTMYWMDILSRVRKLEGSQGACVYFADEGDKPVYSYIKTELRDGVEMITEIAEKKAISNKANSGAYVFPSARQLRHWAAEMLDMNHDRPEIGEYYTSQLIAHMVQQGVVNVGLGVQRHHLSCVGTPEQLHDFLGLVKSGKCRLPVALQKRRFCFDLDMTLVGSPGVEGDYSTCLPIERSIGLVQELHRAGHYIIIPL